MAPTLPPAAINAKSIAIIATTAVVDRRAACPVSCCDEPAPYELYMAGLIAVWALFGLKISRSVAPLLVLLMTFNIGGFISMTQMADIQNTPLYLAVSLFLALTSVFFAAVLEAQPGAVPADLSVAGSSPASPPRRSAFSAISTPSPAPKSSRVMSAPPARLKTRMFSDPSLPCPPSTCSIAWSPAGRYLMPVYAVPLLIVIGGIFFSFSRGAWGLFGLSALLLMAALFIGNTSGSFRLRIVLMGVLAVSLLVLALLVALQIPASPRSSRRAPSWRRNMTAAISAASAATRSVS